MPLRQASFDKCAGNSYSRVNLAAWPDPSKASDPAKVPGFAESLPHRPVQIHLQIDNKLLRRNGHLQLMALGI